MALSVNLEDLGRFFTASKKKEFHRSKFQNDNNFVSALYTCILSIHCRLVYSPYTPWILVYSPYSIHTLYTFILTILDTRLVYSPYTVQLQGGALPGQKLRSKYHSVILPRFHPFSRSAVASSLIMSQRKNTSLYM